MVRPIGRPVARKTVTLETCARSSWRTARPATSAAEPLDERVRVTQPMSSTQNLVSW
jgi:hypothetical protein